ncbi:hypothetical protein [Sodalis sp.]|uniref:hypothetical protein n=1 Tax=Sodalis sp. (in: enterobacteria) TaxID=1898979 RepID=UPI003872B0BB
MEIILNGPLFNRTICHYEIEKIKNYENKSDVESLWGKITDWFCGTQKEEAKKALFDIIHNDNTDIKIKCFNQLKRIASPSHKEKFTCEITEFNDNLFTVDLSISGVLLMHGLRGTGKIIDVTTAVANSVNTIINHGNANLEQLKKDADRFTYTINNQIHKDGWLTKSEIEKLTINVTEAQKKSLDAIASQIAIIAIKNGIHELGKGMSFVGTPESQSISISTKKDGLVKVELSLTQNHSTEKFDAYKKYLPEAIYPHLSMKAKIDIDNKGNHYVCEIKVSYPEIEQ